MPVNRRHFLAALGVGAVIRPRANAQDAGQSAVEPFAMTQVRLLDGPFKDSQELNRKFMDAIPADRLLHTFRLNARMTSTAEPLGGWEKPDCELRGHFTGHYLSACALMHASTAEPEFKTKANYLVAELAKCQSALGGGYLSAFPLEFFDRLNARQKVWAPFYTIHKIMAGMLDVSRYCGNQQAREVLEGMAGWADRWSQPISEEHMQEVLKTEFGGMSDTLYSLAAVTGDKHYVAVARRFEKKSFLDPLAAGRDELKGLHVNTHVPQVIGAARGYEVTQDARYRNIADYFWNEVTGKRAYCTGGTSNDESWLTGPGKLAEELPKSTNTEECCVAYNMLKLTRQLYQWNPDPHYFDYYERVLFNHRLGTLDPETGSGMYYFPLHANSWKVFGSQFDSFWCCTGSGVEEHAKFNNSIYFHDREGVYVNLFIPSEVRFPEKGIRLTQETKFPDQQKTALVVSAVRSVTMPIHVRIPQWAVGAKVRVNGAAVGAPAAPGTYLTIRREWKDGDRVDVDLPMTLHAEVLPDDAHMIAIMHGPIVLAGRMGSEGLTREMTVNGSEPGLHEDGKRFAELACDPANLNKDFKPVAGQPLTYRAGNVTFVPLNRVFGERYGVYWRVAKSA